ncbi:hypothetical protein [Gardnerella sp. Marseille-Q2328]|uniref:hypothetical protein n=1 Tax=Gardnerella sp. Marseille-Q2328 TaxID=2759694 RepID=UPI0020250350|nr:hypothetical protein [Gardnerella sp. Marseille-Q2328]
MFHKTAKTTTNAGEKTPANVPQNSKNNNKRRRKNSRKCSKSLNRHFLYSRVKEKSESCQKAIKTLRERKRNVGILPKSDKNFTRA